MCQTSVNAMSCCIKHTFRGKRGEDGGGGYPLPTMKSEAVPLRIAQSWPWGSQIAV